MRLELIICALTMLWLLSQVWFIQQLENDFTRSRMRISNIASKDFGRRTPTSNTTFTILPKKVYTVVGKESSGTKFVTGIIRDALQLHSYREGDRPYEFWAKRNKNPRRDEKEPIQVQHFSLPQRTVCSGKRDYRPKIVDVVFPSQCSSNRIKLARQRQEQASIDTSLFMTMNTSLREAQECELMEQDRDPISERYFLNLTSHKQWYDSHGTEQYYIIVVRNKEYSFQSRLKAHCRFPKQAKLEESVATGIINHAIRTFLLEQASGIAAAAAAADTGGNLLKLNGQYDDGIWTEQDLLWDAEQQETTNSSDILTSSLIPSKNNVVLVSYEKLMRLKDDYVKQLYKTLGIESDHRPIFKDGNAKYEGTTADRQWHDRTSYHRLRNSRNFL